MQKSCPSLCAQVHDLRGSYHTATTSTQRKAEFGANQTPLLASAESNGCLENQHPNVDRWKYAHIKKKKEKRISWLSSIAQILWKTHNTCPGSSVFTDKCFYTAQGVTGNSVIPMQTKRSEDQVGRRARYLNALRKLLSGGKLSTHTNTLPILLKAHTASNLHL